MIFDLVFSIIVIIIAGFAIKYSSHQFEIAADYLGRKMKRGIKGATINAVGSSMPELLTSIAFIFTVSGISVSEGVIASIAVTAGSAVFNMVIIPALSILVVTMYGIKRKNGIRKKISHIKVDKGVVIRDGMFLLLTQFILIMFLELPVISWSTASILVTTYLVYIFFIIYQYRLNRGDDSVEKYEQPDSSDTESLFIRMKHLDFYSLLFHGKELTGKNAWILLALSTIVLGIACHYLAEHVVAIAHILSVPIYLTSVIIAAAATSVSDTMLSLKDSLKGNYDDAISNAFGSNIFDITICNGIPLLVLTVISGPLVLSYESVLGGEVQLLRGILFVYTVIVMGIFLLGKSESGNKKALIMLGMYILWIIWVGYIALIT